MRMKRFLWLLKRLCIPVMGVLLLAVLILVGKATLELYGSLTGQEPRESPKAMAVDLPEELSAAEGDQEGVPSPATPSTPPGGLPEAASAGTEEHPSAGPPGLLPDMAARPLPQALLTAAAAEAPTQATVPPSGADMSTIWQRVLLALVVLLLLAEASRSVTEMLKGLCAWSRHTWMLPAVDSSTLSLEQQASRAVVINGVSILSGLCVASLAGVDVLHIMWTGEVATRWAYAETGVRWGSAVGVVLTGLIASLGSAFIHDVIGVVQAIRNEKRQALAAGAASAGKAPDG